MVSDTPVEFDKELDTEGGGAYRKIINTGPRPSEIHYRVDDDADPSAVSINDPASLRDGASVRTGANGTQVTTVQYDVRRELEGALITYKFNTPDADRFNSKVDGKQYAQGAFQNKTFQEVLDFIKERSGGKFNTATVPGNYSRYAGPISFSKESATACIDKVVRARGNDIWHIDFEGGLHIYSRDQEDDQRKGEFGINIIGADFSGKSKDKELSIRVADNGKGDKKQFGGPGYIAGSGEKEVYGAPEPLELKALSFAGQEHDWSVKLPGKPAYNHPVGEDGKSVVAELSWEVPDQFPKSGNPFNGIDSNLLTHPNLRPAVEIRKGDAFLSEPRNVSKRGVYTTAKQAKAAIKRDLDTAANSRGLKGEIEYKSVSFVVEEDGEEYVVERHVGVFWAEPKWSLAAGDGWTMDPDFGRIIYRAKVGGISGVASIEKSNSSFSFQTAPDARITTASETNPIPVITYNYSHGTVKVRLHAVVTDSMQDKDQGNSPFAILEEGDYQRHNVVFNASNNPDYQPPAESPRDDSERMQQLLENLKALNSGLAQARGTVTVFPGDETIAIGSFTNGGVVTQIVHEYSPYFRTRFTLSAMPDVDNPVVDALASLTRQIQNEQGINSENMRKISKGIGGRIGSGAGVPAHTHDGAEQGGSDLGAITAVSLHVRGARGLVLTDTHEDKDVSGPLEVVYDPTLAAFVVQSSIRIDKTPEGKVGPPENVSTPVTEVGVPGRGFAHNLFSVLKLDSPHGDITHRAALNIGEELDLDNYGGDRVRVRDGNSRAGHLTSIVSTDIYHVSVKPRVFAPGEADVSGPINRRAYLGVSPQNDKAYAMGIFAKKDEPNWLVDLSDNQPRNIQVGVPTPIIPSLGIHMGPDDGKKSTDSMHFIVNAKQLTSEADSLQEVRTVLSSHLTEALSYSAVAQGLVGNVLYSKGDDGSSQTKVAAHAILNFGKDNHVMYDGEQGYGDNPWITTDFPTKVNDSFLTGKKGWYVSFDEEDSYIALSIDDDRSRAGKPFFKVKTIFKESGGWTSEQPEGVPESDSASSLNFLTDGWLYVENSVGTAQLMDFSYSPKDGPDLDKLKKTGGEHQKCFEAPTSALLLKNSVDEILAVVAIPVINATSHDNSVASGYLPRFLTDNDLVLVEENPDTGNDGLLTRDIHRDFFYYSQHKAFEGGGVAAQAGFMGVRGVSAEGSSRHALPSAQVPYFWNPCSDESGEDYSAEEEEAAGTTVEIKYADRKYYEKTVPGWSPQRSGESIAQQAKKPHRYEAASKWVSEAFGAVRDAVNWNCEMGILRDRQLSSLAASVWGGTNERAHTDPYEFPYSIMEQLWGGPGPKELMTNNKIAPLARVMGYAKFNERYLDEAIPYSWLEGTICDTKGGVGKDARTIQQAVIDEIDCHYQEVVSPAIDEVYTAIEEVELKEGPAGAEGPVGPAGPAGPPGPPGSPGKDLSGDLAQVDAKADQALKAAADAQKAADDAQATADAALAATEANADAISQMQAQIAALIAGLAAILGGLLAQMSGIKANKANIDGGSTPEGGQDAPGESDGASTGGDGSTTNNSAGSGGSGGGGASAGSGGLSMNAGNSGGHAGGTIGTFDHPVSGALDGSTAIQPAHGTSGTLNGAPAGIAISVSDYEGGLGRMPTPLLGFGTPGAVALPPSDGTTINKALASGPEGPTWNPGGLPPSGMVGGNIGKNRDSQISSSGLNMLSPALAGNSSGRSDDIKHELGPNFFDYAGVIHAGERTQPTHWDGEGAYPGEFWHNWEDNPDFRVMLPKISASTLRDLWGIGGGGGQPTGLTGFAGDVGSPVTDPRSGGYDPDVAVRDPIIWADRVPDTGVDATGQLVFSAAGNIFPAHRESSGEIGAQVNEIDGGSRVHLSGVAGSVSGLLLELFGIEVRPDLVVDETAYGSVGVDGDGSPLILNDRGIFVADTSNNVEGHYHVATPVSPPVLGGVFGELYNAINHRDGSTPSDTLDLWGLHTPVSISGDDTIIEAIEGLDNASGRDLWRIIDNVDDADKTLVEADNGRLIRFQNLTADRTLNLPAADSVSSGWRVIVQKDDSSSHNATLDPSGTDTIGGASDFAITRDGETVTVVSDGDSDWIVVDERSLVGLTDFETVRDLATHTVRVATVSSGTLASSFENGDSVDGVTLATGDRILLKDQSNAAENGAYVVQATGAPERAADLAVADKAAGSFYFVQEGTTNADTLWLCTTNGPNDIVGTDDLAFSRFGTSVTAEPDLPMAGLVAATTDDSTDLTLQAFPRVHHYETHFDHPVTAAVLNANGIHEVSSGTGGSTTVQNVANGVGRIETANDIGASYGLVFASQNATQKIHDSSNDTIVEFWAKFNVPSTYEIVLGLVDADFSGVNAGGPTDGIFFNATNSRNSGDWEGHCYSSGSSSSVASSTAPDSTWRRFKITVSSSGDAEFLIDGASVGVVSTNVPGALLKLGVWLVNAVAADTTVVDVDFVGLHAESNHV